MVIADLVHAEMMVHPNQPIKLGFYQMAIGPFDTPG